MKIIYNPEFENNLIKILDYIALDKPQASINFALELEESISNLVNFPYKYRKSIYFNDENIRDLIFKGYTVIYRINSIKKEIEILRIFNKNKPPISKN